MAPTTRSQEVRSRRSTRARSYPAIREANKARTTQTTRHNLNNKNKKLGSDPTTSDTLKTTAPQLDQSTSDTVISSLNPPTSNTAASSSDLPQPGPDDSIDDWLNLAQLRILAFEHKELLKVALESPFLWADLPHRLRREVVRCHFAITTGVVDEFYALFELPLEHGIWTERVRGSLAMIEGARHWFNALKMASVSEEEGDA